MPADASSPIPPALDQLRHQPQVASEEVPDLLERLCQVPDPRDPRGVRHPLAVVLALTACAVLAGATSLLAVGEWIADAPAHVLHRLGVGSDPLQPRRTPPSETTVRRLLARIDGDALDQAIGSWLTDRRPKSTGLREDLRWMESAVCDLTLLPVYADGTVEYQTPGGIDRGMIAALAVEVGGLLGFAGCD
ncbi:transposase family protein [Streptomyces sp. NPDC014636]|uniref:transposase family protein n=1 Tax=Streptomyces sp. NPDC014636 TaxID=3364876 RepID=UPI0036F5B15E